MMPFTLVGAGVVLDDRIVDAQVRIEGGLVAAIGEDLAEVGDRVIDASGLLVAPGYIDLQVNGAGGIDVTTEPERCHEVGAVLARHGVTSWCPTVVTAPEGTIDHALAAVAALGSAPEGAATILGLHLEGPALSSERRGAHRARHLRAPAALSPRAWIDGGGVRIVTLAPELEGAADMIETLVAGGVVVSLGHTAADAATMSGAVDLGARLVTHLFNGMTGLHHRSPGPVGVALDDERLRSSLILDGVHVDPLVVRLAWRLLGPTRFVCVSDAVAPFDAASITGAGEGELGGRSLAEVGGAARTGDGRLAGGTIGLDQAVRNLRAWTGCSIPDAIGAASRTPADVLGVGDRGRVEVGAIADLTLLTPDLEVVTTFAAGYSSG